MNTKDNGQRTTDYSQQSAISTKEIDKILDSMMDNRTSTKAVIYIACRTDGQIRGDIIGEGKDIEEIFYSLLKNDDDCAKLMSGALERLARQTPDL